MKRYKIVRWNTFWNGVGEKVADYKDRNEAIEHFDKLEGVITLEEQVFRKEYEEWETVEIIKEKK